MEDIPNITTIQSEINQVFGNKVRMRVCGICIQNDQILLIRHAGLGPKGHLWAPPGGGIDFGEPMQDCLKREFLEETNLEVEVGNFLFVNEFIAPPLHAIELFFEVRVLNGLMRRGKDPELSENNQMIDAVAFMDIAAIKADEPECYHNLFKYVNTINEIRMLRGVLMANIS